MLKVAFSFLCAFVFLLCVSSTFANAENVCFQCHQKSEFQGKIVHAPVEKGQCGSCHNPHVAKHEDLLVTEEAKLCSKCHQKQMEGFVSGFVHEPVEQGKCSVCHMSHASNNKGLISPDLAGDCLKCHENLREEQEYTHRPFAEGACMACHSPHNSKRMTLLTAEPDALCSSCHDAEKMNTVHKGFPATVKKCLTCHNPHTSKRVALLRNHLHKPYEKGCSDCHTQKGVQASTALCLGCHENVSEQMFATHSHLTRHEGNSCLDCHSPHAGDKPSLLLGAEKQVCSRCHLETLFKYKEKKHKHSGINQCSACHEPHGASKLAMLKGTGTEVCALCHEDQGSFTHPIGPDILDVRTGQTITCVTCHNPMGTDYRFHLILDNKKDLCVLCHKTY